MSKKQKHNFLAIYNEYLIIRRRKLKDQSFQTFKYNFEANILSYFSKMNIEDISENDIYNWEDFIVEKNFCNNHNKNLFSMLKDFFAYCNYKYNIDDRIICDVGPIRPKVERKKKDFYTFNEFNQFINYVDNNIYKQFFNLMFFCGTRPGEAMALKFSDLNDNTISIIKTIDEHRKRKIDTPKTLSSIRDIIIDDNLKNDLLELKKYYIKKYNNKKYDYFIFGGMKPLSATTINRYKLEACEKANIRPITLHQFRHSHATLLLNQNIDIHVISKRLGHSKVSTTLDIYTHANLEQEKRVYDTLNSLRTNNIPITTSI